jgi:hypothetical protein
MGTGPEDGEEYLARRGPGGGWTVSNLQPTGYHNAMYRAFSPELSIGYLVASSEREGEAGGLPPLTPEAPAGVKVLYSRAMSSGDYDPVFTTTPPNRHGEGFGTYGIQDEIAPMPVFAGASADGSHVLFVANDALTPEAEAGNGEANNLYESVDGVLRLVNVLPDGGTKAGAIFGGAGIDEAGYGRPDFQPDFSNVISSDGSLVFWTDLGSGRIYMRRNGRETAPVSPGAAEYETATPAGRFVFYVEGEAMWRFDTETEVRTAVAPASAKVMGLVGASEDGEYVYFIAEEELATGAGAGEPNLYLWHAGTVSFIATLAASDGSAIYPYAHNVAGGAGDWDPSLGRHTAEVTPDGQGLVFMSSRSLTGYDNETPEGTSLVEVYVYSSEDGGHLYCASCNPSGQPPPREDQEIESSQAAGFLPISWSNTFTPQWLSSDGGRVFFDGEEQLTPLATNGTQNVYEWERDGEGSCTEANGCIFLISSGTGKQPDWLLGESPSGDDVFFASRAQLVAEDGTEAYHLFDARIGGFVPPLPAQCSGTGCQGLPSSPPVFATPSSVTFAGVGNFPPPTPAPTVKKTTNKKTAKCKKGYTKNKQDKCVKVEKKAEKKAKAKKSSHDRRAK